MRVFGERSLPGRAGLAGILLALPLLLAACGEAPTQAQLSPGSIVTTRSARSARPTPTPLGGVLPAPFNGPLFVEPDDGLNPVISTINGAQTSIDLVVYLLNDQEVMGALRDARNRGVRVRVMLEQRPYGNGPGNQAAFQTLQGSGVEVRWSSPRFALTHEKSLVVDGGRALIMTANLTHSAFTRNREYGVLTADAGETTEVAGLFQSDWQRTSYIPTNPNLVVSPDNARQRLTQLVAGAREALEGESEETQDRDLAEAIATLARRGARVRYLTTEPKPQADPNLPGMNALASGGVQVRTLAEPYMHAKMLLADGQRAYVGSINISTASLDRNRELGILTSTQSIIARIRATFERDWAAARVYGAR